MAEGTEGCYEVDIDGEDELEVVEKMVNGWVIPPVEDHKRGYETDPEEDEPEPKAGNEPNHYPAKFPRIQG